MKIFSFLIIIFVLFLGVTFAGLNSQEVTINYYVNQTQLPLSLLLVLVLGVGGFIGWLTGFLLWLRLKAENMRLSHKLKVSEKEVNQLRTLPLNETQ
ncbi:MAG TPA: lipopolysaccharide assembly protein LapA domain-containing protein [Gammaproteobacteria bacterium]|nr:lipopolysaccharide assembly protein LapA domain-containing protein [Gammaproteobacteria bacterium]HEV2613692.1 lipopolysaccharide assembly protein LapA domain-containing protein [Gammaproteobacteria bacterium]